jgi:type II secretory pathway component GspD/PulD (secretin)
MSVHEPIKQIVRFFADRLSEPKIIEIVESGTVRGEAEARQLLSFIDRMLDLAVELREERELVLGEPIHLYDLEKTAIVLQNLVAKAGFEELMDEA